MNILDGNNFIENKNGRISELQLSLLKSKVNIWFDLLLFAGVFAVAGFIKILYGGAPWVVILGIPTILILVWLGFRLPLLVRYYFLALPDARRNNIGHTSAKLDYNNEYILKAEEIRLSLFDGMAGGLIAGNVYDVFYLPRAKMAISAKIQQTISESQQAQEFTFLFGKVIGYTAEDTAANRSGEIPFTQRLKILRKHWLITLALAALIMYMVLQVIPTMAGTAYKDDAIIFGCLNLGLILFLVGVLYISSPGAKGVFTALLGKKVEQAEGILQLSTRISMFQNRPITHYYLEILGGISLEIPQYVHDVLINGHYCRIFYSPRTKYLLSLEVLRVQEKMEQNASL